MKNMISGYVITAWLTTFTASIVGILVYVKNPRREVNKRWAFMSLSIAIWSLFLGFMFSSKEVKVGVIYSKLLMIGANLIPITFYHFILVLLELDKEKRQRTILLFGYLITLLLLLVNFSPLFVKSASYKSLVRCFYPDAGPFYIGYILIYFGFSGYAYFLMHKASRKLTGFKRNQIIYVMFASAIGFLGGATTFLLWYQIKIPPLGSHFVWIYSLTITIAILRHQLMEIEVLIKKSLVFAGMFAFVFGVVVVVAMLIAQLLGGTNTLLSLAISALIITFTLRPLETWLINATDKFLFQKKYEYKQILKTFIDEVITVLNLDEIVNSTLKLLDQTLHPYTSAVFILNKVEDKYQLYNSQGLENKNITFTSDSRLVTFLKKSSNPAVIKQIDGITGVSPEIIAEMSKLKAVLVLPLMLHNDLIGFISLGRKKSDEEYSKDDLDVLLDLARTESIAVGNAQLLAEAAQTERRAAIGTMAAGIHHEIGNPLNIINTKIQVFLTGIERGFYKDKSREEVIQECQNILNETLNQTNRIADTTKRLANFAKPSKEFRPQLVNIPEEIEETLAVVGHDLELDRIKIEKRIALDLPKVLADRREIQQIFFNLIRNAGQAIEESGTITIKALSTRGDKVHIEIQDTGKGIPEDRRNRIFEPFFTTKGPKGGTGLGLSIVRQLVFRNKGEISFLSQVGVGTTFILEFPKGE